MQCYAFEIVRAAISLRLDQASMGDDLCDLDVFEMLTEQPDALVGLLLRDRAAFDGCVDQVLDRLTVALPAAA